MYKENLADGIQDQVYQQIIYIGSTERTYITNVVNGSSYYVARYRSPDDFTSFGGPNGKGVFTATANGKIESKSVFFPWIPKDLTGATIILKIYEGNTLVRTYTVGDGITILNAAHGEIEINIIPVNGGNYTYALDITDAEGISPYTYQNGCWTVIGTHHEVIAHPEIKIITHSTPTLNNSDFDTQVYTVNGLVVGGNYNIQLATVIPDNVTAVAQVIANNTVRVTVTNNTGDDGLQLPSLTFKIYIQ